MIECKSPGTIKPPVLTPFIFYLTQVNSARIQELNGLVHSGTQWFTLARPFAEWLLTDTPYVPKLKSAFANLGVPDEVFFSTLAFMSKWRDHSLWYPSVLPMPVRSEHWEKPKCGPHPCILTSKDIQMILDDQIIVAEHFRVLFRHSSQLHLLVV